MLPRDQIIRPRRDSRLVEEGQPEGSAPRVTAIYGIGKPRRAGVGIRHANSQSEIRSIEVDAARAVLPWGLLQPRRRDPVQSWTRRYQSPMLGGIFDRPRFSSVLAASQKMLFGPIMIDGVTIWTVVLEIAGAKPH